MTRLLRIALVGSMLVPCALVAQQRTVASSGGDVTLTSAAPPVLDTAVVRLQQFLDQYGDSPLRPRALFQLGELLVRRADANFAAQQRASGPDSTGGAGAIHPDYTGAIARYQELVTRYPNFDQIDAAEYTLGTLYATELNYAGAAQMFERVAAVDTSRFRPEALFRLGDARFELASRQVGEARRAEFASAANAYEQATKVAQAPSDIYFLSLYKLGWSYYNQANQADQADYQKAVNVFGQLVDAYDKLTPEQQSRLGLRGEAIEYMAVAFTQVGGSEAANKYFAAHGMSAPYRLTVVRRVAESLRDQGDFTGAVQAYSNFLKDAPSDSSALGAMQEVVDIYQNRMLEGDSAQAARLRLVQNFGPGSAWAQANPTLVDSANKARDVALRQSAQYLLASAQGGNKGQYAPAAALYKQYLTEFPKSDSAQAYNVYYAEALFGTGDYASAGAAYEHAAYGYSTTDTLAQEAGRNAIVAYDSALAKNKTDKATQDAFFGTVDRFVAAFPNTDLARKALIEKGRQASETQRWDAMANAFQQYAQRYPDDPYTPTAQRLIGDALYRGGQYQSAQTQWQSAQEFATAHGKKALADSIAATRTTAAASYADTLIKQGQYGRAADEVYLAYAKNNPQSDKAPDALRNAIETYMLADSVARVKGDQGASNDARQHAIDVSAQLLQNYPNYKYAQQYAELRARLLDETGKRDESVAAYQQLIAANPSWSGRADAMVRVAVMLDSLGKKPEAAQAYAAFAQAYPRDQRASGALYNAAVTYEEAGDKANAANTLATFASRYPRDERAAQARAHRIDLLKATGDTAAVAQALATACQNPTDDLRATCASQIAAQAFSRGLATFQQYQPIELVIPSLKQLNAAGVKRASAEKQQLMQRVTAQMAEAIRSGIPEYLAAATYYVGLTQWEYGNFVKNVKLPDNLTDAQRTAAVQGATQQAEQYYQAARQTWQELVQKAHDTPALGSDAKAKAWIDRADAAAAGRVDSNPGGVSQP